MLVNLQAGELSLPVNNDNCQYCNGDKGLFSKYLKNLDAYTRGKYLYINNNNESTVMLDYKII